MKFREIKVRRDPQCPLCGERPTITELIDYHLFCGPSADCAPSLMNTDEVTVQDLKRALDNPSLGIHVIDVREPDEHQTANIPGTRLLPLSQLASRFQELERDRQYYLHCQAGVRSMRALQFLRQQGFKHLKSVKGGLQAWNEEIEPGGR
jgi:adenylyltransferase/sulfurtransferase